MALPACPASTQARTRGLRELHASGACRYPAPRGLCSRDGAHEHTQFLGFAELSARARYSGLDLIHYRVFLMGLNQCFEYVKRE
jgi:hypothetical protein